MSDMQLPPVGPGAGPMPGGSPMEENRSVLNPTDATMMGQQGKLSPDMTVEDLITGVLGVPLDAPASALGEALKRQVQNASPEGKVGALAGGPGGPGGPGRPPMVPPPGTPPAPQGADDLLGQL